ncbi:LutC/YkgG family protein [Gracilibacillus salinarum]|uniref:Lactate utilization protein C n=1 Tax=Gracilibacillus salinarum TaxID=2932255 RepID=A0ABY4GNL0_9BACI|nr:lactate utilization protein C [Gracilibacillus salinarum]UOQ85771.1 lactate utilization protein C [Gracilibacillus salinarum]
MPKGSITNRDSFLANIREKIGGISAEKPIEKPQWSVTPQKNVLEGYDQDQLVTVLEEQCKEIHTDFFQTTKNGLADTISSIMEQYASSSVIYPDDSRFSNVGLDKYIQELDSCKWDNKNREGSVEFAEKADIGITFSDMTLAESGTVVLLNEKFQGRSISLLPTNYVAIVPKSSIVKRMTQATDLIHELAEDGKDIASCINFITGPSNSADIEMNLVVGVHGPIHTAYIVVDDL